jgi:hypothetical protein
MADKPRLTPGQCADLRAHGLFPEQVQRLDSCLLSIWWRLRPAPPMAKVRGALVELERSISCTEMIYTRALVHRATLLTERR